MTTWLDTETIKQWTEQEQISVRTRTILEQMQDIIDNDEKAVQCLRRSKRKGLFKRIIKARRYQGVDKIPLRELRDKIQTYVEEDHCYQ